MCLKVRERENERVCVCVRERERERRGEEDNFALNFSCVQLALWATLSVRARCGYEEVRH